MYVCMLYIATNILIYSVASDNAVLLVVIEFFMFFQNYSVLV